MSRSIDHYFGTHPHALNRPGECPFHALPNTPDVNGLTGPLLTYNPNLANPHRLSPADQLVCDQDHDYDPEQAAWDGGLLDRFVQNTSGGTPNTGVTGPDCKTPLTNHKTYQATNKLVMDYYDGNTVTALWNYARPHVWSLYSGRPESGLRRHITCVGSDSFDRGYFPGRRHHGRLYGHTWEHDHR